MFRYQFPVLDDISELLKAIEGREEFSKYIKEGPDGSRYQVLDYHVNFHDTFPDFTDDDEMNRISILRRECRGLIADPDTGEVISRSWHKFHNVGERPTVASHLIDLSHSHVLMEKLDGSMIRPYVAKSGNLQWNAYPTRPLMWGTMAGVTDVAENARAYLETSNVNYQGFARETIEDGYTPIFEWCSRKNRIVVDHPVDGLILTGIRHRRNGNYLIYGDMLSWANRYGIPVVQVYDNWTDINELIAHTRGLDADHEGYVVRFSDGHMVKIKADMYCRIHKVKEHLIFEKNVVELILRKQIDDVLPDFPESDQARIRAFTDSVYKNIYEKALDLAIVVAKHAHLDQKAFAFAIQNQPMKKLLFTIRTKAMDPRDAVIEHVLRNTGTQTKMDSVRHFIGPRWETF